MPQFVDIPDVGEVEFPDGMSADDISTAIQTKILKKPPAAQAAPPITAPPIAPPQVAPPTAGPMIAPPISGRPKATPLTEQQIMESTWGELGAGEKLLSDVARFPQGAGGATAGALKGAGRVMEAIPPTSLLPGEFPPIGTEMQESEMFQNWLNRTRAEKAANLESHPLVQAGKAIEEATQRAYPRIQPESVTRPLGGLAEGLGNVIPTVAIGIVGGAPAAIAGGTLMELSDAYDEEIQRQKDEGEEINPDKAMAKASLYATTAGAIEAKLGVGRIMKKVTKYFGKEAGEQLEKHGMAAFKDFVKERAKDFGAGFAEEALQRLSEDLIVHGQVNLAGAFQEGMMGAGAQTFIGGGLHGVSSTARAANEFVRPKIDQAAEVEAATAAGTNLNPTPEQQAQLAAELEALNASTIGIAAPILEHEVRTPVGEETPLLKQGEAPGAQGQPAPPIVTPEEAPVVVPPINAAPPAVTPPPAAPPAVRPLYHGDQVILPDGRKGKITGSYATSGGSGYHVKLEDGTEVNVRDDAGLKKQEAAPPAGAPPIAATPPVAPPAAPPVVKPAEPTEEERKAKVDAERASDLEEVRKLFYDSGIAGISWAQRNLKLGYNRAKAAVDAMVAAGEIEHRGPEGYKIVKKGEPEAPEPPTPPKPPEPPAAPPEAPPKPPTPPPAPEAVAPPAPPKPPAPAGAPTFKEGDLVEHKGKVRKIASISADGKFAKIGKKSVPISELTQITNVEGEEPPSSYAMSAKIRFDNETDKLPEQDILGWIKDNMRMMSKSEARRSMGDEWWRQNSSQYDDNPGKLPPHHNLIYSGKSTPNQVATAAFRAGMIKEDSETELWDAIKKASDTRMALKANEELENKRLDVKGEQHEAWTEATKTGKKRIDPEDVAVGDTLIVDGEPVKVTERDNDTGSVTLDDGAKFGIQVLDSGESIWVEKHEQVEDLPTDSWMEPEEPKAGEYPKIPEIPKGGPIGGFADLMKAWREAVNEWLKGKPENKPIIWEESNGNIRALTRNIGDQPWRVTTYVPNLITEKLMPWGHQVYATREAAMHEEGKNPSKFHDDLPKEVMTEKEIQGYKEMSDIEDKSKLVWYKLTGNLAVLKDRIRGSGFMELFVKDSLKDGKIAFTKPIEELLAPSPTETPEQYLKNYLGIERVQPEKPAAPTFKPGDRVTLTGGDRMHADITGLVHAVHNDGRVLDIVKDGAEPGMTTRVNVEDYKSVEPAKPIPKLRPGEKGTGDLLQGAEAPFNLAGEEGKDVERIAREKAEAEKRAAEAKAKAEKEQLDIFAPKEPKPEGPKPKVNIKEVDELGDEPSTYAIGVGAGEKRFTLWHRSVPKSGGRIKWQYIQNLGNTKESAMANVNAAIAKHAGEGDVVLARKQVDTRTLGQDAVNPEGIIRFGKYQGRAISEMPDLDMGWSLWAVKTFENDRDPAKRIIANTLLTDDRVREAYANEKKGAADVAATLGPINEKLSPFNVKAAMVGNQVVITGETYGMKDIVKEHNGRWNNDAKGWAFTNAADFEGFVRALGERAAGTSGRLSGGSKFSAEGAELAKLRDAVAAKPDESGIGPDEVNAIVGDDTKALLLSGEKAGIPRQIIEEQIEDTARIVRAQQTGKPMIILGSDPGSGKTFVLGAAIRELKKRGAKTITYVTMNRGLIAQIQADLKAYGIEDVNFITYAGLRELEKLPENDALIFDEAHNIKNLESAQGKVAQNLLKKSKFNIFSTATPFENPSEVAYLDSTGVFKDFDGWKNFAKAFGADSMKIEGEPEIILWKRNKESNANQVAAREFFARQGMFAQRDMKIDPKMTDTRLIKVHADEKWAGFYKDLLESIEESAPGTNKKGEPQFRGYDAAWIVNFQKRILEASKVQEGIRLAKEALARGRQAVIFVETKAEREIDIPDLIRRNEEWNAAKNAARMQKEKPPSAKEFGALSDALTNLLRSLQNRGHSKIVIESAEDLIEKGLGKDNVAIYTGSITDAKAQKNLQTWRDKQKKVLVATMAKGGTGLSLHDKIGDRPTTQININLPWKATGFKQVSGRTTRYGMRSKSESFWLFSDNIPFDQMLAGRVGGRLQDMGAIVNGAESVKLAKNITDFDWNSEADEIEGGFEKPEEPPPPKIIGMGGAIEEEFAPEGGSPTAMRYRLLDEERQRRGLPPLTRPEGTTDQATLDRAMAQMDLNPELPEQLISDLLEGRRHTIEDWENHVLMLRKIDLKNSMDRSATAAIHAYEDSKEFPERKQEMIKHNAETMRLSDELTKLERASNISGSARGRALRALRVMLNEDYELVPMMRQARAAKNGAPLDVEEVAELKKIAAEYKRINDALTDKLASHEEFISKQKADLEIERQKRIAAEEAKPKFPQVVLNKAQEIVAALNVKRESSLEKIRKAKAEGRVHADPLAILTGVPTELIPDYVNVAAANIGNVALTFAEWSTKMIEDLGELSTKDLQTLWQMGHDAINRIGQPEPVKRAVKTGAASPASTKSPQEKIDAAVDRIAKKLEDGKSEKIVGDVRKIVRELIKEGITEREEIVDRVHGYLADIDPQITRREAMDAISGYGKFTPLSKDEISKIEQQLRGELQQLAKLEDIAAKKPIKMTGVGRPEKGIEWRNLIRQVNEAKRRFGVVVTDPERQLKGALDARKTYYRNRIGDLETQVERRQKFLKTTTATPTDTELEMLKAITKTLKDQFDEIFDPELSQEEQLLKAIQAEKEQLEESIAKKKEQLATGDIYPPGQKMNRPDREELEVLKLERDDLNRQLAEARKKPAAQKEAEKRQRELEALEKKIAEKEAMIASGNVAPQKRALPQNRPRSDPRLEQAQLKLESLNAQIEALRNPNSLLSQAEKDLKMLKLRINRQIEEYKRRMDEKDFEPAAKKEIPRDPEAEKLEFDLFKVKRDYQRMLTLNRIESRSIPEKILAAGGETLHTARAIMTSADLSAVLRQGAFILLGRPLLAAKSFPAMFQALMSEEAAHAIDQNITKRKNYPEYVRNKLYLAEHGQKLSQMEEVYMSRWADDPFPEFIKKRFPELTEKLNKANFVAASQRAYTTFLNKLRADTFDTLAASLTADGKLNRSEGRIIANYINVATGRGHLGAKENALVGLNTAFFAPRYVLSRFQLLGFQPLWHGVAGEKNLREGSGRARALVAKEYARTMIAIATIYALSQMGGADVEDDPRSSDFGKIRIGKTRIDPMAGLIQATVFASRMITRKKKSIHGPVTKAKWENTMADFARSKLAPGPGTAWDIYDIASGDKPPPGHPQTVKAAFAQMITPMTPHDIYDSMRTLGVPAATALGILSIFGVGVQTYD